MKKIILILILSQISLLHYGQIIADHTIVDDYDKIPDYYIAEVKKMRGAIPGLSHASGYLKGLIDLEALEPKYQVSVQYTGTKPTASSASFLRFGKNVWDALIPGWTAGYDVEEWCTDVLAYDPIANTKAGIAYTHSHGYDLDAMGFGWCWDTEIDIDDYIYATQQYVNYVLAQGYDTKIYFTTGNVAPYRATTGTAGEYAQSVKYETIRNYVDADSDLILFDYADILCWSDAGVQKTVTYNGHTYPWIADANSANEGDADYYAHISTAGCLRLAKAMWWMLARMAGWDGVTSAIPVEGITITGAEGASTVTAGSTLQLSDVITPSNSTINTVTWSITNETGQATVNSSGLVSAVESGIVIAKATANDDSGTYGTLLITILNKTITGTKTLGNTDVYRSSSTQNFRRAIPVTLSESGSIQSLSIYHNGGTGRILLGVYSDLEGVPFSLLGVTAATPVNSKEGWQTINLHSLTDLTSPINVISGQTVWLSWIFEKITGVRYTTTSAGELQRAQSRAGWSEIMPATFGAATFDNFKFSVYLTYLPGVPTLSINVSPASISLDSGSGSSGIFNITSNTAWSITEDASWLEVSPVSGSDDGMITLTTNSANTETNSRSATIIIAGTGAANKTVTITQEYQINGKNLGNIIIYGLSSTQNYRRALPVTFNETGDIQSLSIYHNGGTGNVLVGVYSNQTGTSDTPGTRLGVSEATVVNSTTGWQTITLTSPVTVSSGQKVWLSWVFQNNPGVRYMVGTPYRAQSTSKWTGGMPATFGSSALGTYKFSVYCTYATSGAKSGDSADYDISPKLDKDEVAINPNTTGTEEKLLIYPNPNVGSVTVTWENNNDNGLILTIYNSQGSLVKKMEVEPSINQIQVDLNNIQKGMYLLELKDMNGVIINRSGIVRY